MKFGGRSWNGSTHHKAGVLTKFQCKQCGRHYKMEWAKVNHEKLCIDYWKEKV